MKNHQQDIGGQGNDDFDSTRQNKPNNSQAANGQGNPEQEMNELDKILLALQSSSNTSGPQQNLLKSNQ